MSDSYLNDLINYAESPITPVDYAHESTGFPTWHRQYLLWMEWEIQYMLKSSRPTSYHQFRLPYWDWRHSLQSENNSPFKESRLGTSSDDSSIVRGDLFQSWNTTCWPKPSEIQETSGQPARICNPNVLTRKLQRCPSTNSSLMPCSPNNPDWPTIRNVNDALGMSTFDASPYDKMARGFRNYLEGFVPVSSTSCNNDNFCNRMENIARTLHNKVSRYKCIR